MKDTLRGKLSPQSSSVIFLCNHEEADTRMVLHACLEDTIVIVVSKDTDVLILLIYAYAKHQPANQWYMKIDKYISINSIVNHFGAALCIKLPHIHAITRCDTTSFLHGVGKVKVLKKLVDKPDLLNLMDDFGDSLAVSDVINDNITKFIQQACYSGQQNENLVGTIVRMYKKMKTKSSLTLPLDPKSMTQHIRRVCFQLYEWIQFNAKMLPQTDYRNNGWEWDEGENQVVPKWFEVMKHFVFNSLLSTVLTKNL